MSGPVPDPAQESFSRPESGPELASEPAPGGATGPRPLAKDPMRSFRGVLSGVLVLEAITVALALPVVARLGGGIGTGPGIAVLVIAVAMIVCCALIKRPWVVPFVLLLQVALIAFVVVQPAIAIIGILFLALWLWLLWLRRDVARRMAAGTLPAQQPPPAGNR